MIYTSYNMKWFKNPVQDYTGAVAHRLPEPLYTLSSPIESEVGIFKPLQHRILKSWAA